MSNYCITVSRGYGSGGRTIGKMLSEELGIPFMTLNCGTLSMRVKIQL